MDDAIAWLPIPGLEPYLVSASGQVLGKRGCVLKPFQRPDGYVQVKLQINGRAITRKVHLLVATAFLGPCPAGLEVRHRDGDQANNCAGNLLYGTHSENTLDLVRLGKHPQASQTHCIHGHEFTAANTYMWGGRRNCRACVARRVREQYRKTRAGG